MVRICASGMITPMGNSEEEIWNNLIGNVAGITNQKVHFESALPGKVKRRNSRFSDMAATAAINCYRSVEKNEEVENKERVGCIFSTDYGPLETNIEFAKQIIEDEPDNCSPSLFSNTVHNACLGTISIQLGIKGPSTMLLGSNQLLLASMLLKENKADYILAGAAEEYNEDLKDSLNVLKHTSEKYADAAVVMGLCLADDKSDNQVYISDIVTFNLGAFYPQKNDLDNSLLRSTLEENVKKHNLDAIIINNPDTELGLMEKDILKDFPNVIVIDGFYKYFGNCLGADMSLKTVIGKMILEKSEIPKSMCSVGNCKSLYHNIGVLSGDITGNYYITVLNR